MFISFKSNDVVLQSFVQNTIKQISNYIVIEDIEEYRSLCLNLHSLDKTINIDDNKNQIYCLNKPFHISELMEIIYTLLQGHVISLGYLNYLPASGSINHKNQSIRLSETQNKILSYLVCCRKGVLKRNLYQKIWPRDKEVSENKLDTHLTNLRNLIYEFSEYHLNFKTLRGLIKLDIN